MTLDKPITMQNRNLSIINYRQFHSMKYFFNLNESLVFFLQSCNPKFLLSWSRFRFQEWNAAQSLPGRFVNHNELFSMTYTMSKILNLTAVTSAGWLTHQRDKHRKHLIRERPAEPAADCGRRAGRAPGHNRARTFKRR